MSADNIPQLINSVGKHTDETQRLSTNLLVLVNQIRTANTNQEKLRDSILKNVDEQQKRERTNNAELQRLFKTLGTQNADIKKYLKNQGDSLKKITDQNEQKSVLEKKPKVQEVSIPGLTETLNNLPKFIKDINKKAQTGTPPQAESGSSGGLIGMLLAGLGAAFVGSSFLTGSKLSGGVTAIAKSLLNVTGIMFKRFVPILKKIPVIGSFISIYDAYKRFKGNDPVGGGISILSAIAGLLPPPFGISMSTGLDILNAVLDYKAEGETSEDKTKSKLRIIEEFKEKLSNNFKNKKYDDYPVIGPLAKAKRAWDDDKMGDFVKNLAYIFPPFELAGAILGDENAGKWTGAPSNILKDWTTKFATWITEKLYDVPVIGKCLTGVAKLLSGDVGGAIEDFADAGLGGFRNLLGLEENKNKAKAKIKEMDFDPQNQVLVDLFTQVYDLKRGSEQGGLFASKNSNSVKEAEDKKKAILERINSAKVGVGKDPKNLDKLTKEVESLLNVDSLKKEAKKLDEEQTKAMMGGTGYGYGIRARDAVIPPQNQKGFKGMRISNSLGGMVQLDPQDGIIAGPFVKNNSSQKVEQILEQIAVNTAVGSANIANLIKGFNQLAVNLQEVVGNNLNITPVPIQTNASQPSSAEIARQGNPENSIMRSMYIENNRPRPAGWMARERYA